MTEVHAMIIKNIASLQANGPPAFDWVEKERLYCNANPKVESKVNHRGQSINCGLDDIRELSRLSI